MLPEWGGPSLWALFPSFVGGDYDDAHFPRLMEERNKIVYDSTIYSVKPNTNVFIAIIDGILPAQNNYSVNFESKSIE